VFAIEIDGLSHDDSEQAQRDIIKNRLCASARLPLLRLGIDALDESQEISVLEWLVQRFISWQDQGSDYRVDSLSPLVHDVVYPFPGNLALVTRLFNRFGIGIRLSNSELLKKASVFEHHWLVQASNAFGDKTAYCLEVQWPGQMPTFRDAAASEFVVSEIDVQLRDRAAAGACSLSATGQARLAWAHKTRSTAAVPPHALMPSPDQLRALGLSVPDLPWLDPSAITDELAIYDALSQVERWAARGLPISAGPRASD